MRHLFTHEGEAALAAALRLQPLLDFDFDGALAPIPRPDDVRMSLAVSARLKALASRLPMAIATGQMVDDVRGLLGFEPLYIFGNHGGEDPGDAAAGTAPSQALSGLRVRLQSRQTDLAALCISMEDKGASRRCTAACLESVSGRRRQSTTCCLRLLRVFGGKMVANISLTESPDKSVAVHALSLLQATT